MVQTEFRHFLQRKDAATAMTALTTVTALTSVSAVTVLTDLTALSLTAMVQGMVLTELQRGCGA